jgi:uncharacterized protein YndB with AHSA1/START domain
MPEFEDAREMSAEPQAIWRVVSDPQRLPEWVPTTVSSRAAGEDTVELKGESHGHDYDMLGRFVTDEAAHELFWYSPRQNGYRGALTVVEHPTGSLVTLRVVIPDIPPGADAEVIRGLGETLDRINQLTTVGPQP